jgi:hypothetical protein
MTLIGIFAYIFLVGKVERIQVKNAIPEVTENPVSNNN